MERANFGGLDKLINARKGLGETNLSVAEYLLKRVIDENHTAKITYQVCSALSYLHSHGVVHRDIKPAVRRVFARCKTNLMAEFAQNILVMNTDPLHVKLADFGFAKSTVLHGHLEVRLISRGSNFLRRSDHPKMRRLWWVRLRIWLRKYSLAQVPMTFWWTALRSEPLYSSCKL